VRQYRTREQRRREREKAAQRPGEYQLGTATLADAVEALISCLYDQPGDEEFEK